MKQIPKLDSSIPSPIGAIMSENLLLNASFNGKAFVIESNVSRVDKFLLKGIKLSALSNGNITIGVSGDITIEKLTFKYSFVKLLLIQRLARLVA